ncbi:hypothetical protein D1007_14006 [Hordeum vulgare]|nr:hypothetical protein D1007_14006 [Hordeum vulgare]
MRSAAATEVTVVAVLGPIVGGATARGGAATTSHSKGRGALLGRALLLGLLGEGDPGEDSVEGEALITEDDTDGIKALVEAMEKLGGEIHLSDDVIDVSQAIGEEFHAARVFRDGKITLLEVAILAVENHVTSGAIGKEEVLDLVPESEGGGGAADVITHRIEEGGVDPQDNVSVQLEIGSGCIGRGWMLNEIGRRGVGVGTLGRTRAPKEKRGANWEPEGAVKPPGREEVLPKTNGGEDATEEEEFENAAGVVGEEKEPDEVAELVAVEAEGEESGVAMNEPGS